MKFWKSAEWQRIGKLRGLKLLLIGITLIPSIYAVIFLSSLWDAYGNVSHLPVAVVNQDKAAKINGKTQHLGSDLSDKLIKDQPLKISEVSYKKAQDGLKQGKYYMTITIPSDFTSNAGTLLSGKPNASKITIAHNAGQSFIAEKMTSSAAAKIQTSVTKSLQKVYNETILSATKSSQKGLQAGANGANQLNNGLGQLADGTKKLNDGASSLTSGSSTLAGGLNQYTNGVSQANNGSNQLTSGANSAANGANQLASGTSQLAKNAPQLEAGSQQLATGAQELSKKLQEVSQGITDGQNNEKTVAQLKALDDGLTSVTDGLSQIEVLLNKIPNINVPDSNSAMTSAAVDLGSGLTGAGVDIGKMVNNSDFKAFLADHPDVKAEFENLQANVNNSATAAGTLETQLNILKEQLDSLQSLQGNLTKLKQAVQNLEQGSSAARVGNRVAIGQLNDSLTKISNLLSQQFVPAANQLASGAATLNAGQKQVTVASSQLNNGASQLASGNSQLAVGASQLNNGLDQLHNKSGALNSGASQLNSGAQQLTTGTSQAMSALGQAQNGAQTLASKMADGAVKLEAVHGNKDNVNALTNPVKSAQTNLSTVQNNGTGMAPYMMSVGLFVGMITLSTIYDFMTVAKKPRSGIAWWADKQTVNFPVWIGQALVMTTLLVLIDGLNAARPVMVFVVALVAAFSFNQLVLFFNVLFGKLGSGIMLVLMVLQLSASAGSYPIELSNEFFRTIHPWVPMTYSVHAFRETISIGGSVANDLTILLIIGLVSMVLTWGVYHWKLRHNQLIWSA
ncbi:YhgE/Pip domain-containing protein [Leuconostoc gasicomitatum]|uniref:YhgE/Pip domain-containing protein n=1 Tax=Leuconostoc gasicomitatum TaxID=115778 RepID=UPI00074499FD|nr:YhgE/Pip domain-containing protein [Leuconostoc gasicomitatum]MBZ5953663.1 YhgE/Pip domain-containing protein [Leuconostoc gasicomitatum]MBZ5955179.1 YhgE/Pip domain-containing protein [Leuconostoc gasicomitatum]MBZ5988791.1 YhgE/Pip domain-containing protein [Leuconostoc gasicomitatum]MBZ5989779.1 YhgE/Pip domain-containing protein [Leuconostoc gasicomitatum]CUR62804.1 Integral membrane protein [Leuconostoc gasicomitatum KG16-1]